VAATLLRLDAHAEGNDQGSESTVQERHSERGEQAAKFILARNFGRVVSEGQALLLPLPENVTSRGGVPVRRLGGV
jgi:hypothetical protein